RRPLRARNTVLAAGLLLLLVEMFFLPGFTVAGVIGVVAIMAAIAVMVVSGGIGTRQIGGLVLASAGAAFLARHIPRLPAVEGLLRMNPRMWDVAVPERYPDRAKVGDIGVVVTPLRLGGKPDSVTKSSRFNLKGSSLTSELTWK
ncbi:MAG: hypothetical protein ACE5I3_00410, partial [Phycisphaerae bacterium]